MGKKDPRVDAYIAKSAGFARPILKRLRMLVHKADPKIEETLKWSMPSFMHDGLVCNMAAFKQHCAFGFWKGKLILDKEGRRADEAMGQFGRIASLKDLPPDRKIIGYIRKAVRLNQGDVKVPGRSRAKKATPLRVPAYFMHAVSKDKQALKAFQGLSTSYRNEYVEWVSGAKREETRIKRLATAVSWLKRGRNMNWRYEVRGR
ncbi:MAG TPA: YdeI/OmpD-associated family protein [Gammaproteobacteria bacterium]|nr:YdeI/OmpD-associated family protein [Gammaproteobacteria bacterium]